MKFKTRQSLEGFSEDEENDVEEEYAEEGKPAPVRSGRPSGVLARIETCVSTDPRERTSCRG